MGDRLLAINGQALLGLSRDDAVLLLKHAHDQVSLQIEYDVCHKGKLYCTCRKRKNGTYLHQTCYKFELFQQAHIRLCFLSCYRLSYYYSQIRCTEPLIKVVVAVEGIKPQLF